jgi:hypothetical protein
VRRACIQAVESRWFANTTMAFIILNSLSMGLADYSKVDPETMELATEGSYRNQVNSGILEPVFIAVFSIECVIKVIAMGFVWGKDSYLRDPWNRLGACAGRPAWNADTTVPRLTAPCCTAATPGTDFIVVASALLELIPGFPGLRYLRSFRLLRPLRTISHFPTMRAMVAALMASIPALSCVVGILFFVFAVWCAQCMLDNSLVATLARSHLLTTDHACSHRGILALQFWGRNGDLTGRCRLTPFPVKLVPGAAGLDRFPINHTDMAVAYANNHTARCSAVANDDAGWTKASSPWAVPQPCVWPIDLEDSRLCALGHRRAGHQCTGGKTCGSNFDRMGNPRFSDQKIMDSALYVEDLNWGYTGFDNMGAAMLTIFQCITLEGWTPVQYMVADGYSVTLAAVYFTALTLFGGFFLLNMTLAVIEDAYSDHLDERSEQEAAEAAEAAEGGGGATAAIAAAAGAAAATDGGADSQQKVIGCADMWELPWAGLEDKYSPFLRAVVRRPWFEHGITCIIVINTVVLAMDAYPEDVALTKSLLCVSFLLSVIFFLEMLMKMCGLGLREYFAEGFNCFDFVVVTINLAETVMDPPFFITGSAYAPGGSGGALSALRTFRLFRVLRLFEQFKSLRRLVGTVIGMVSAMGSFAVLLFLMAYIFALLGMQLFANRLRFDEHGYPIPLADAEAHANAAEQPRTNFDDLLSALLSVFQALTGEDWNALMYTLRRARGDIGWIYVIVLELSGVFVVLNLFLAVLLGGFESWAKEEDEEDAGGDGGGSQQSAALRKMKKPTPSPRGSLLFIVPATNGVRRSFAKLLYHHYFERFVMMLILLSSVALAIDNPFNDPDGQLNKDLASIDYLCTAFFLLEMIVKLVVLGVCGHEGSYLRDGWNVLDFFVVACSVVSLAAPGDTESLRPLKVFRACRALRPLRVIARHPGMRQVVNALIASVPGVANVCVLLLLFFLIFGILGVSFFKGTFFSCQGDVFDAMSAAQVQLVTYPAAYVHLNASQTGWGSGAFEGSTSKAVCLWMGAEWAAVIDQNFNNVFNAMALLLEMGTTEGWVDMMHATTDAVGVDMQPIQDYARGWCAFSVLFLLLGAFFMLDLFVGVIIDNFNRLRRQAGGRSVLMTEEQEIWQRTERLMASMKPRKRVPPPEDPIMRCCYILTSEQGCVLNREAACFDLGIMGCIIANTLVMSATAFGQTDEWTAFTSNFNVIFAWVFTAEAVIKLLGIGWRYFHDSWNRFDFVVVCMTDFGMLIAALGVSDVGPVGTAVRAIRILRIVRLVNKAPTLRVVFNALILTLPSLFNVSSLLFLMYFIFAVLGVQIFATVQLGDTLNTHANFQSFGGALMLVVRASTGESWNFIMHDAARSQEGCVEAVPYNANYCGYNNEDGCVPVNGCGVGDTAIAYFFCFTVLVRCAAMICDAEQHSYS